MVMAEAVNEKKIKHPSRSTLDNGPECRARDDPRGVPCFPDCFESYDSQTKIA